MNSRSEAEVVQGQRPTAEVAGEGAPAAHVEPGRQEGSWKDKPWPLHFLPCFLTSWLINIY